MEELAGKRHLWAGVLRVENAQDIQSIEIVPWRNRTGKVAKWSGLVEGAADTDPPMFILKPDAASSGDYSNLEIKWKTRPANLEKRAVDYRVAIVTDMDEEIIAREVGPLGAQGGEVPVQQRRLLDAERGLARVGQSRRVRDRE